ncbi:MAG: sortase [Acidimicrobiia bacterium]
MDSTQPSPDAPTRRWTSTLWLGALALLSAVALAVVSATSGAAPPVAHGVLPRTASADTALAPDLLHSVLAPPPTTTTTRPAKPAAPSAHVAEDTTLHTPEDVPDPSVRRPISIIGRIQIPSIGLDTELRDQITQESIDLGPSHWPGTAAPGGFGNAVVAGHRSSHSAPFHDLGNLHAGDTIVLVDGFGQRYTYSVTELFVVNPDAIWITKQTPGHTLTLFTCHPIGSSAQRLVVRATLT